MIGYSALGNLSDGASQVLKPLRLVLCSRLVTPWEVRKTLDSPGKSVKSLETETIMRDMDYKPFTFTLALLSQLVYWNSIVSTKVIQNNHPSKWSATYIKLHSVWQTVI